MNNYDTNSFKRADSKKSYGSERTQINDAPAEVKTRGKKDTKRWCKGVVGREHKSVWVYSELLWAHRRGESIQEPPLPPIDRPERDERGRKIYYRDVANCASLYCTVCQKQMKYATDAYKLRREGIAICTTLPESQ